MAYDATLFSRVSSGNNYENTITFSYGQNADTLATIKTSGYFNANDQIGAADFIFVSASDGNAILQVTGMNPMTVIQLAPVSADSIDSQHYVDGSIDPEHLASNSVTTIKIADAAVTAAKLAVGVAPIYKALYTTVGGSATQTITASGVLIGDIVIADINTHGASPVSLNTRKVEVNGQVKLVFSGNPSTDHVVNVVVFRP